MLINHTNHLSKFWSKEQLEASYIYGEILDLPFPNISPRCNDEDLNLLVEKYLQEIIALNPNAVLCQGEFVYSYRLIQELKKRNMIVLAACSMRRVVETVNPDGTAKKESIFEFVKFREY